MLLILLIAVPAGIGLAVLLELFDNRGERMETWIEDAHALFARPGSDVAGADLRVASALQARHAGTRSKAFKPDTTRSRSPEHRRAA